MGKPHIEYSEEIASGILGRIAEGESLRRICSSDHMPSRAAVLKWVDEDREGLQARYELALTLRAQTMEDELLEIADNIGHEASDTIETKHGEIPNKEWILRSKLRVDTRKWIMARMAPKRYGDKITQEITGKDGGPIQSSGSVTYDEAMKAKIFVETLRSAIPDPQQRSQIIASLPEDEARAAAAFERIATLREKLVAQRFSEAAEHAANVEAPASFRGEGAEEGSKGAQA